MPFDFGKYIRPERAEPRKTRLLRAVVSLSLANLCLSRVWHRLLYHPDRNYVASPPYGSVDYVAALGAILLIFPFIYVLVSLIWHSKRRWIRSVAMATMFAVFIILIDFVIRVFWAFEVLANVDRDVTSCGIIVALLLAAIWYRQRLYSVAFWACALFSPYIIVNIGKALQHIVAPDYIYPGQRLQSPGPVADNGIKKPRVVWIVFDEWDQNILFDGRPSGLQLPVLDGLIKESVTATQAYPPAAFTRGSIPAMLSGRLLSAAQFTADGRLEVRFAGESHQDNFSQSANVISDAVRAGKRVTVVGWYHAYDRILAQSPRLTAISWGLPNFEGIRGDGIWKTIIAQMCYIALPMYDRMVTRDRFIDFHACALRTAADPAVDFAFLHYPVPHLPGIYDAKTQKYSVTSTGNSNGYLGNLALVDHALGDLLDVLNKPELRETTTLVVSSDHWWRSAPRVQPGPGYRVPLIIRSKGQGERITLETPVCTTSLRTLIFNFLQGTIVDNLEAAAALSRVPLVGPIRYENGFLVPFATDPR